MFASVCGPGSGSGRTAGVAGVTPGQNTPPAHQMGTEEAPRPTVRGWVEVVLWQAGGKMALTNLAVAGG
jgi:hypothetical protein